MARTPIKTNQSRLLEILQEIEGESGLKNRGTLYQAIADQYNKESFVMDGQFKPISHSIVKFRLQDEEVPLKTPLGKRTKTEKPIEILSTVEDNISITEETPDGSPIETPKPKVERKTRKKSPENNKSGINVVKIPRGECPLPLSSFDTENIIHWADRMREVAKRNDEYLTVSALQFYIRKNVLADDADKARAVCDIIKENVSDEYS